MKKVMDKITVATDSVSKFVCYFAMITIVVMMVLICVDVVMGNFLGHPLPGIYELCSLLLTTTVFSSWAYTQTVHGHIHVTMFVGKMPQKLRFICFGLTSVLSTIVMGIATYAAVLSTMKKYQTGEFSGTLQIPFWPFYIFMDLAFALLCVLLARDSVKALLAIGRKDFADEVQASWT